MRLRRIGVLTMALTLALCGCSQGGGNSVEEEVLRLRTKYLELEGLTASVEITADYGQRVYVYGMDCSWQAEGESLLTITSPPEVAGVTIRLAAGETQLEFDGARLETGDLTADGLSPVDALPVLLRYVREGFIAESAAETLGETETLRVICREPGARAGEGQECTIWFDRTSGELVQGELSADGVTVIRCVFGRQTAA